MRSLLSLWIFAYKKSPIIGLFLELILAPISEGAFTNLPGGGILGGGGLDDGKNICG
jgi:hypothetical protein